MPPYDLGLLQNATDVVQLVDFVQNVTSGKFFLIGLFALFVIVLLNLLRYGFARAFVTACFLCFILSAFLSYLGYIPVMNVFFFVFGIIGSLLWFQFHPGE